MTTDELIRRAYERLAGTSNPSLPPEETLSAIVALGKERDAKAIESDEKDSQITKLQARIDELQKECEKQKSLAAAASEDAKNNAWVAMELGLFVAGVANHQYDGTEAAAARRIYNLNSSSLRKKMLNGYAFDSYKEAKEAYEKKCKEEDLPFDDLNMLIWLYDYAPHS